MQSVWRRDGFTIIELVIVLVVIVVLLALIVPAISLSRSAMRQLHCAANLQKLGVAAQMFAMDHDGVVPMNYVRVEHGVVEDWHTQMRGYVAVQSRKVMGVDRVVSQKQVDLVEARLACPSMVVERSKNRLGYAHNAFTSSQAWQPYDGIVSRQRELYLQLHPEMKFSPAYGWYRMPLRLADVVEPSKTFRMTDSRVMDLSVDNMRSAAARHGYDGMRSVNMLFFDGHVSLIEKQGMHWDKPRSRWWLPYEGY